MNPDIHPKSMRKKKKTSRSLSSSSKKHEKKPYLVFVSHATHDKWIATVLCEKKRRLGRLLFEMTGILKVGKRSQLSLRKKSTAVMTLWSYSPRISIQRQWVLIEIGMACATNRRIIPLMYHVDGGQIPDIIKDDKGYSLNELDRYLSEVTKRVAKT